MTHLHIFFFFLKEKEKVMEFREHELTYLLKKYPTSFESLLQIYLVAHGLRTYLFESANVFGQGKSISRYLEEDFVLLSNIASSYGISILPDPESLSSFPRYFFVHPSQLNRVKKLLLEGNLLKILGYYPGFEGHQFEDESVTRISYTISLQDLRHGKSLNITALGEESKTSRKDLIRFCEDEVQRFKKVLPSFIMVSYQIDTIVSKEDLLRNLSFVYFKENSVNYKNLVWNQFTLEGKMNTYFNQLLKSQQKFEQQLPFLRSFISLLSREYFLHFLSGQSPKEIQKFNQRLLVFEQRLRLPSPSITTEKELMELWEKTF